MQDATEIQPLTPEQRQAVKDCRWSTLTMTRSLAWLHTDKEEIALTLENAVNRTEPHLRDSITRTMNWDMRSTHPEVMGLVTEIMEERRVA